MDPILAAALISAVKEIVIRYGANSAGTTPEEYKKKVEALQPKADALEERLRKKG